MIEMGKAKELLDMFEMSNLGSKDTNLSRVIWVSSKGKTRHAPRIKIQNIEGDKSKPETLDISITIEDNPKLVKGNLLNKELEKYIKWIKLNKDVLLDYWYGNILTREMLNKIKRLK